MRIYCKLMSNQCCLTPAAPAPSFPLQTRREIREGEITIITDNLSDFPVFTDLAKLDDDKTWQDMLDYIGEPGSHKQRPYFITKENRRVVICDRLLSNYCHWTWHLPRVPPRSKVGTDLHSCQVGQFDSYRVSSKRQNYYWGTKD